MPHDTSPLLEVSGLTKSFVTRRGFNRKKVHFTAVDDVRFSIDRNETVAVVGESGAGKSTTGRLVLRLIEPDAGTVTFGGDDVRGYTPAQLRGFRQRATMIFQDPHSSLDPRLPIAESVGEPLLVHGIGTRDERRQIVNDLLSRVGLAPMLHSRYPSQLSGGQLQRAAIARSLTTDPALIVCDEAVSALDASIRAQVIDLLNDLQDERGIAYMFITHDLALVESFADRAVVMRHGKVVEQGPVGELFTDAKEQYTRDLLAAVPYVPDFAR